jgi:hypothetical protein
MNPDAGRLRALIAGNQGKPKPKFSCVWACECRAETECKPEDLHLGSIMECPACHQGRNRSRRASRLGRKAP